MTQPVAPSPADIYRRAVAEGDRRLRAPVAALASTGFNAGCTIVLGIAGLALVHGRLAPHVGEGVAHVAGASAFAVGLVLLTTSRSELFTENFFDPVATVVDAGPGERPGRVRQLVRLWAVVLLLNLVGGALLVAILSLDGVLPASAERTLRLAAEEMAGRSATSAFANAVVGGVLVTLLSFLLNAVDSTLARMVVSFLVGFLLAVGPFAHVVVTFQHLLAGALAGAAIGVGEIASGFAIAVAGNLLGGLGFVTFTHVAQGRTEG